MAKKKKQLYKLWFDGTTPVEYITNVQAYGHGIGVASFFFNGNKSPAILVHTDIAWMNVLEQSGKLEFVIDRSVEDERKFIIYNNDKVEIATLELEAYFVINSTEDKAFFELRQKPSGGWVLTHSVGLLQEDLSKVRAFILEAI